MENPIIQSILEEEAQAALSIQAARDKAAALIRETKERIREENTAAQAKARELLEAYRQEAAAIADKAARKAEEEAMAQRAVLRAASSRKIDRAAEAVLSYLR